MNKRKKGISLILLVITIIIMLILSGVVIVSLSKYNSIDEANNSVEKAAVAVFKNELEKTHINNYKYNSKYRRESLNETTFKGIVQYIPSFDKKYENKYVIYRGELVKETMLVLGEIPIYTPEQFAKICSGEEIEVNGERYIFTPKKKYILMNDLDFTGKNLGQINIFNGILDGNNHKILNYSKVVGSLPEDSIEHKGSLINYVTPNSVIRNLTIENASVTGGNEEAILAGSIQGGKIYNVTIKDSSVKSSKKSAILSVSCIEGVSKETGKEYTSLVTDSSFINNEVLNTGKNINGNSPKVKNALVTTYLNKTLFKNSYIENNKNIDNVNVWHSSISGIINSKIENLDIKNNGNIKSGVTGLLANLAYDSIIDKVNIENNSVIESTNKYMCCAALIARSQGNKISNVTIKGNGTVKGDTKLPNIQCVGGILGYGIATDIENCINYNNVNGTSLVSGIAASINYNGSIINCKNYGNVTGQELIGGVLGDGIYIKELSKCENFGNITSIPGGSHNFKFGGIAGGCVGKWKDSSYINFYKRYIEMYKMNLDNIAKVENLVNRGNVTCGDGKYNIGGVIGTIDEQYLKNLLNLGKVESKNNSRTGAINGREKNIYTTQNLYCLEGTHSNGINANVISLTEEELRNSVNLKGFNFINVWKMGEDGFPTLK